MAIRPMNPVPSSGLLPERRLLPRGQEPKNCHVKFYQEDPEKPLFQFDIAPDKDGHLSLDAMYKKLWESIHAAAKKTPNAPNVQLFKSVVNQPFNFDKMQDIITKNRVAPSQICDMPGSQE
jgi:hypothetical protein